MISAREIDPMLAIRLSALTDGEGCFYISAPRSKGNYYCSFIVRLRADDCAMLERFRDGCGGIGRLVLEPRQNDWAPTVAWIVQKKKEVGVIRDLFELWPLWSKKARDFEVWARAYDFWCCVDYGTDWTPMIEAREELRSLRKYEEVAA